MIRQHQIVKVHKDAMFKKEYVPYPRRQDKILGTRADVTGERKAD